MNVFHAGQINTMEISTCLVTPPTSLFCNPPVGSSVLTQMRWDRPAVIPLFVTFALCVCQVAKTVAQRLNTDPMLLQFFKSQG